MLPELVCIVALFHQIKKVFKKGAFSAADTAEKAEHCNSGVLNGKFLAHSPSSEPTPSSACR
jgi:hypothetical protein